jgi:hypothetical protein
MAQPQSEPGEGVLASEGTRGRAVGIPPVFRYPKYRVYWFGFFLAVSGHQIFQFVQFLLMYELTDSVVALNSTIWQSTRIVGPAVAGVIVGMVANVALDGMAVALYIASSGYVAMVVAVAWVRTSAVGQSKGNPVRNLRDGLM